jgi:hypothetical protein
VTWDVPLGEQVFVGRQLDLSDQAFRRLKTPLPPGEDRIAVTPLYMAARPPDSKSEKARLSLTVLPLTDWPSAKEQPQCAWRQRIVTILIGTEDDRLTGQVKYEFVLPGAAEPVPPSLQRIPLKTPSLRGAYLVPYARVKGEMLSLLVLIGDPQAMKPLVAVVADNPKFNWADWRFPIGR